MPRSDKKDTTCACYDYKFTKPAKLRQHYQSNKNQCSLPPENINQRRVRIPKANDEAFELQPIMQDEKQEGDPKAGPGSTIQAHREGYKKEVVPTP
ncbi:hypothetical protein GLOIN_2v1481003 [Rhizophagus irregularis DAOM 181602=DAOM 197198]|nr:hypothetical protein GLOIN_2v1481003 [Rhizophagus irregularis DAOM 181602=DAOM 197198]